MIHALNNSQNLHAANSIRPAKVLEVNGKTGQVLLIFTPKGTAMEKAWAEPALLAGASLQWGQRVLAAFDDSGEAYVIGILDQPQSDDTLVLRSGARALIGNNKENIRLFSKTGSLMFQYDDSTGKCQVTVPSGDLEFNAPNGNIDFIAARGIRMFSKEPVELKSLQGIKFAVADLFKNSISLLNLGPKDIHVKGEHLDIKTQSGEIKMDETTFQGTRFNGRIQDIRISMDRLQTHARDIIQRASNVYQNVENLAQMTTRRLRTLVSGTHQIKSKKIFVKAEEDVKIKGNKIHLG